MNTTHIIVLTIVFCAIILISTIWSFVYIQTSKKQGLIAQRKKWIDQLPSMISSLGVLGTFTGIAIGLTFFDPYDISESIPQLLEGLKTAFYTSLCGMAGSMILTRFANVVLDNTEYEEDLEDRSSRRIVDAINRLQTALTRMNNETTNDFKNDVHTSLDQIKESLNQIKDDVEELKGHTEEMKEDMQKQSEAIDIRLGQISSVCSTATASISKIDNVLQDVEEQAENYSTFMEEVIYNLESLNENK